MPGKQEHFADRLLGAIQAKGSPVCVGLDPVYEKLPGEFQKAGAGAGEKAAAMALFCRKVVELVAPAVPAVKIQSAYFEVYREAGVRAYFEAVAAARQAGLLVIGDVKRNDIGSTAEAYAAGHLRGAGAPDAVTVNGYLGADGILPFVEAGKQEGRGLFVLVRTSNPSGAAIQDFEAPGGRKLYEHVAEQVAAMGAAESLVGRSGYSLLGAVVGATYPEEARRLRALMPQQIFLVPGYGAQGAMAADCAAAFKKGAGAIVNASRSVIFAHKDKKYAGLDWQEAVRRAAKAFADDIRKAVL